MEIHAAYCKQEHKKQQEDCYMDGIEREKNSGIAGKNVWSFRYVYNKA